MQFIKNILIKIRNKALAYIFNIQRETKNLAFANSQMLQVSIMNQYTIMKNTLPIEALPKINQAGFKVYSQFDEDGILLYIFSLIGFTNKRVVEICAGTGEECNCANLIINHGCEGLLFDGNAEQIEQAKHFFGHHPATWIHPPQCISAWITKDNINKLIENHGFTGSIDFLSLDIDGIDYYVWDAIDVISPRVVICESHNICPDDMALTIPYAHDFDYTSPDNYHEEFRSVSPRAMINLAAKKGYRLIGAHKYGFNIIFMRNDVGMEYFPEIPLEEISNNPYTIKGKKERWPAVKDAPWVIVKD